MSEDSKIQAEIERKAAELRAGYKLPPGSNLSPKPTGKLPVDRKLVASICTGGGVALILSLISISLTMSGAISVIGAYLVLAAAWILGVLVIGISELIWESPRKHGWAVVSASAVLLALVLAGVGIFEKQNQPKANLEIAKVEIKKTKIFGPSPIYELTAVTSIKNTTNIDATITGSQIQPVYTNDPRPLTAEEENEDWERLVKDAKRDDHSTLQIPAGGKWSAEVKFSIFGKEEYEAFTSGGFRIYIQQRIEYRNEHMDAGKYKVTEACYWYEKDFTKTGLCKSHNQILAPD